MISGVRDVYYNVSDVNRALAFYTGALQMTVRFQHEFWVALDCGGVAVGLHPTGNAHDIVQVPRDSHGAFGQATLTLKSDDVPGDRKRIEAAGGKILGENDAPWGHMLVFEDPDGNVLKLMNPKG